MKRSTIYLLLGAGAIFFFMSRRTSGVGVTPTSYNMAPGNPFANIFSGLANTLGVNRRTTVTERGDQGNEMFGPNLDNFASWTDSGVRGEVTPRDLAASMINPGGVGVYGQLGPI